jgi:hypothetical protein
MGTRTEQGARADRDDVRDAILDAEEPDAAIDAWTLEELDDDLADLRWAVAGTTDGARA